MGYYYRDILHVSGHMSPELISKLRSRVVRSAEALLDEKGFVNFLDVLCGMQLLSPNALKAWQLGRIDYLEADIQVGNEKLQRVLVLLNDWAKAKGQEPGEAHYVRNSRAGTVELRVTVTGDPVQEKIWRTQYVSPKLTKTKREKLAAPVAPKLTVFQVVRDSKCSECGTEIEQDDLLTMEGTQALCMACAGLSDLEFLEAGDTALTRRATKYSPRTAVVVRFSRARKRYERQGILVEPQAIARAESECADDAEIRAVQREKAAVSRVAEDKVLTAEMTEAIRQLFPRVPANDAREIAAHTAVRGSGRVGRTAAGRKLDENALKMAVIAAVRHRYTDYDALLARGVERSEARERIAGKIEEMLERWRGR
jgi:hypothetical protein